MTRNIVNESLYLLAWDDAKDYFCFDLMTSEKELRLSANVKRQSIS